MTLENKYNVSRETIKKMVNEGIIPCSVVRHYEIYDRFLQLKTASPSRSNSDIFYDMATEFNIGQSTIDKIVYKLHKK